MTRRGRQPAPGFARKKRKATPRAVGYAEAMSRAAAAIPDATWRAIETRDRRVDGRFVYGVTSTHVFCRPSCPSRRPRRDRVRLFRDAADAEAAGSAPAAAVIRPAPLRRRPPSAPSNAPAG